jgi:hypothetical protein
MPKDFAKYHTSNPHFSQIQAATGIPGFAPFSIGRLSQPKVSNSDSIIAVLTSKATSKYAP